MAPNKSVEKVSVKVGPADVVIEIGGIPHLILRRADLVGVESWIKTIGAVERYYFIEFVTKSGLLTCDYDDYDLWREILLKLAGSKLFNEMQGEAVR